MLRNTNFPLFLPLLSCSNTKLEMILGLGTLLQFFPSKMQTLTFINKDCQMCGIFYRKCPFDGSFKWLKKCFKGESLKERK